MSYFFYGVGSHLFNILAIKFQSPLQVQTLTTGHCCVSLLSSYIYFVLIDLMFLLHYGDYGKSTPVATRRQSPNLTLAHGSYLAVGLPVNTPL